MIRLIAVAALMIASSCAIAPRADAGPAPVLLIGNKGENTLSFVDLGTGAELGRSPTGKWPHEIAVSPDGRQAAVVAYGGTHDRHFRRRRPGQAQDHRPCAQRRAARAGLAARTGA